MLPETRGKTYILRILSVYRDLFRSKYGFMPSVPIARYGRQLKALNETHSELQVAAMLIVFFDWKGMSGDDNFTEQKLIDAGHALGWFFSTVNTYEIFLRNVYKLDFDKEEEVKNFVSKSMLSLN